MPALIDIIDDSFPANGNVGVPLQSTIFILFNQEMDEDSISEAFFIEGPDTDQFVGPGLFGLQIDPNNISQGNIDDFLKSPGYKGIVEGTFTYQNIDPNDADIILASGVTPYRTKAIFTPTQPLAASIEYTVLLSDMDSDLAVTYSGLVNFSFTTGTGSIETLPSSVSTSVLTSPSAGSVGMIDDNNNPTVALSIVSTTPADDSVENVLNLTEIVVEFNKNLNPVSAGSITIETIISSDHPELNASAIGTLAKTLEVDGKLLKIKI